MVLQLQIKKLTLAQKANQMNIMEMNTKLNVKMVIKNKLFFLVFFSFIISLGCNSCSWIAPIDWEMTGAEKRLVKEVEKKHDYEISVTKGRIYSGIKEITDSTCYFIINCNDYVSTKNPIQMIQNQKDSLNLLSLSRSFSKVIEEPENFSYFHFTFYRDSHGEFFIYDILKDSLRQKRW